MFSQIRTKSWLGAFFRKMRTRQGTPKAITMTDHKLLRLIIGLFKNCKDYVTKTNEDKEAGVREYTLRKLAERAKAQWAEVSIGGQLSQELPPPGGGASDRWFEKIHSFSGVTAKFHINFCG